ncbi:hypothetical protein BS78_02G308200 [Paspalum vaginatum]|nr:hypothetical protein BS78_02G308200 [Paspalum vaginatum]
MESPLPLPALTNALLEEIFLRVASPADLARASTACVSFRCLISNPAFLRRYRSIHPPLFLGFLGSAGFQPAQAPQPNAAIAAAVARAADFSFDYLPPATEGERYRWLRHVLGGRVLFECGGMRDNAHYFELVVCDPLFRRYLLLPSITDDLLASADIWNIDLFDSRASLIPCAGMEDETSFSVICWMTSMTRLAVFVFSSVSGRWSVVTSIQWAGLGLYGEEVNLLGSCGCVYGCFYWKIYCVSKLLKLDMNTMELSTYDLPPDHDKRNIIIVELGEGKIAMVSQPDEGASVDCYTFLQNGSETSHEWHLMNTIPLPADYTIRRYIDGASEGHIFLVATPKEQDVTDLAIFSIEIKSRRIERACTTSSAFQFTHPYFGFPPSMSPRRIQGY